MPFSFQGIKEEINMKKNLIPKLLAVALMALTSCAGGGSANFGSGNLLEDLVTFVRRGVDCRLVLIGDAAQLPPVGLDQSPALSEAFMAGFGGVRFSTLTTVVRQQRESGILWNATRLRERIADAPESVGLDELGLLGITLLEVGENTLRVRHGILQTSYMFTSFQFHRIVKPDNSTGTLEGCVTFSSFERNLFDTCARRACTKRSFSPILIGRPGCGAVW